MRSFYYRTWATLGTAVMLASCTPFVPVMNIAKVAPEERMNAVKVQTFMLEGGGTRPQVERVIAEVESYSCKFLPTDPPPSKGDALLQLQIKAQRQGANGLLDVTFDASGTDFGTNCWAAVHARGLAVLLPTATQ